MWIQSPFSVKVKPVGFCTIYYENLIDITSDSQSVQKCKEVSLITFWGDLFQEYSALLRREIRQLIPFASTDLCETGFSNYAATKTKYRNRLNAASDLRIQLYNTKPNTKKEFVKKKEKLLFALKIANMRHISF
jgi:hypothetical protein